MGNKKRRLGTSEGHRREKGNSRTAPHDVRFGPPDAGDSRNSYWLCRLVFQNINVNSEIDGRPPILYAADYGQTDVIDYLISAGADVNVSITLRGRNFERDPCCGPVNGVGFICDAI